MFTLKKTKDGLFVDKEKPHSTMEVHFVLETTGLNLKCIRCKKPLKDGQVCGLINSDAKMVIAHEECP